MAVNSETTHHVTKGDTATPLGATLTQGGSARDLTGETVEFKLVRDDGLVKLNWTAASIVTATSGTAQYDFQAADVSEAGEFWGYFRAKTSGGEYSTFPSDGRKLRVVIHEAD